MDNLELAKQRVNLLHYIERTTKTQPKPIGGGKYQVNPCPICKHSDHFTVYPETNSYSSFSGCTKGGSIIDFIMETEGLDTKAAIAKVKDLAGVGSDQVNVTPPQHKEKPQPAQLQPVDYSSLIEKAATNTTPYYTTRGLTEETVKRFRLGYLPEGHPQYGEAFKYVLPVSDTFVIFRGTGSDRYRNTHGTAELFNLRYIHKPTEAGLHIYITEGMFDALSLEQLGYSAIALNSTSGANKLKEEVQQHRESLKDKLFVLALDADKAGQDTAKSLADYFRLLGLSSRRLDLKGYHDVNDYLVKDPDGLQNTLDNLPFDGSVSTYLSQDFWAENDRYRRAPNISTGLPKLDRQLGGGLYPGLYVIGATTSLGKTALAMQIADRIAADGHSVLYFSLEMGRYELVCRSLTREAFVKYRTAMKEASTGHVINGRLDTTQQKVIEEVLEAYRDGAGRCISIIEGGFDYNITTIREVVTDYIRLTGNKPVVFIDYLQVLRPISDRMNDKQAVDYNIVECKRLSRDMDAPVVVISSFNRASYQGEAHLGAFKESGSVEFTADVCLALHLPGTPDEQKKALEQEPRQLQLVTLKNRRGRINDMTNLQYYPKHNLLDER